ncbi:MAG: hypothetical protein HYR64_07675 [Fimbriimonas ginsengisoli]|uniref:Organic solvent tolerance-like N-terminal domain-containing protein n=1 Tax=Fimbriimonas ginsengisoli TaxID=1005039 RepID=A0A931LT43_FIMGI|nr:hypothetical protein [Fimbriimonas ginsengisoli]
MLSTISRRLACAFGLAAALPGLAGTQATKDPDAGWETIFFETRVGSFKVLGTTDVPARGHLEVSFKGTVLVSGLNGSVGVQGAVRKQYEDAKHKRTVYFGAGKIVVDGSWQGVQWFGRDSKSMFRAASGGAALVRLTGEFDQNLKTGEYWFAADPSHKDHWLTSMITIRVPRPPAERPTPVIEPHQVKP